MTEHRAADVDENVVRNWLREQIARTASMPVDAVDTGTSFAYFGLNSLQYVDLAVQLETWLGRELAPTAAYDFPTIDLLARYVAQVRDEPERHAISPEAWT